MAAQMDVQQGIPASSDEELILECQSRFRMAQDAESSNREQAIFDKKFVDGDQWDTPIQQSRTLNDRPCLTINITGAVRNRVVNACRENRPRIKVHPVSDGADVQTAKVMDGLIRHIEVRSNADFAYDVAIENAIDGGWGYIGVDGDYETPDSFDQELKVIGYSNPFICYMDPASRLPDGSDMEWFLETTMMRRVDYRAKFGEIEGDWSGMGRGDNMQYWSNKEEIRVAKYWRIEKKADKLCRLSNGAKMLRSKLPSKEGLLAAGLAVVDERDTQIPTVACYLMTAFKVLNRTTVPGRFIPRVPVYGRRMDLDGKITLKGMVRDLRDVARTYNYAQTAKTEAYALQPKAPWMGAEGFMDGHEGAWRDANRKPIVGLEYKPVLLENGQYAPPPERQMPPQPNAGFAEWADSTKSDFLAVAGMPNDPNQDMKGEVVSGIALRRRQGLSDISHYDFYDNLTRSLRHLGRIIVDMIPHYYDTPRMIRIIQEDGTPESVAINQPAIDKIKNDLTVGKYEVVVDTGPAYQTKREESVEAMMELLGTPLGELVARTSGDLIVRSMDFPNSDSVADRLIAAIPAAQMDKNSDLPPKAQAVIAGLQAQLKEANQKQMALELELHAKMGLEKMRQDAETERTKMKLGVQREDAHLKSQTAMHDTHIKAVTAHDVAEINATGKILDTHVEAEHNRRAAEELAKSAAAAEKRDI